MFRGKFIKSGKIFLPRKAVMNNCSILNESLRLLL